MNIENVINRLLKEDNGAEEKQLQFIGTIDSILRQLQQLKGLYQKAPYRLDYDYLTGILEDVHGTLADELSNMGDA